MCNVGLLSKYPFSTNLLTDMSHMSAINLKGTLTEYKSKATEKSVIYIGLESFSNKRLVY